MIDQLYSQLPGSIRDRIGSHVLEEYHKIKKRELEATELAIPRVELQARHIQSLEVYIDREALLADLPKGSVVAEIGVAEGDFSEQILSIALPAKLHLIDSWSHDERYLGLTKAIAERFARQLAANQVQIHQGYSTKQLGQFEDGTFDWVYLDTGHEYEATAQELELCRMKVKKGGIIAGHDYVTGYWMEHIRYGVIEAVHEFCLKHHWEMIGLTHETHRHLSYALREIIEH